MASARMEVLSRPPESSSPRPSRSSSPSRRSRATSASVIMFTVAARSLARSPSGRSGNRRYARSVTTRPSTASPRNSSRSFVRSLPCSNACDRWVSDWMRRSWSRNRTRRARSRLVPRPSTLASIPALLPLVTLRPRRPGARGSTRSSRTPGAAAWAAGTAGTGCRWGEFRASGPGGCPAGSPWSSASEPPSLLLVQLQPGERGPPGIDRGAARALAEVPVASAPFAQAEAVGTAQRRERHGQHHAVPDHRLQVDGLVPERVLVVLLAGRGREQLGDLQTERLPGRLQAPSAAERHLARQRPRRQDALDDALQDQVRADRVRHRDQLHGQAVDRRVLSLPDLGQLLLGPGQLGLERGQLLVHVVLGLQTDLAGLVTGLGQDPLGLLHRGLHDLLSGHQLGLLSQGFLDELLGVTPGLGQQLLAVLDHPAGLLDLLGKRGPHLLDQL